MIQKIKRWFKPTILLLIIGFSISLMSVIIGISSINCIIQEISKNQSDIVILQTIQNTGLSLSISIYLFSIVNSFVVTNYRIISEKRNLAIFKAFGWENMNLIFLICKKMIIVLIISFSLSVVLLCIVSYIYPKLFKFDLTVAFVLEVVLLFILTLALSMIIPTKEIIKIEPAEVIS